MRTIRKIIKHPSIKNFIIKILPRFYTISESLYVRYKDKESNYLDILCDKEKLSLDIGTLWGGYTYLIQKYSKMVYCFEPNKTNHSFLKRSFKYYNDVKLFNMAVSDREQTVRFRIPQNNPGNATIESENLLTGFDNIEECEVKSTSIDKMRLENIGFIKIDIEGHELKALEGMLKTITEQRPILLIESENRHYTDAIQKVTNLLHSIKYELFFLFNAKLYNISDFDLSVHQIQDNRNTNYYINNFISLPLEQVDMIINKFQKKSIGLNDNIR